MHTLGLLLFSIFKVFNVMKISVQFSHSVVSDSLRPHELQHVRPPCPSPSPGVYSNSCPLSLWCHPTVSSTVIPFSCLQSFPASGSFQMSQFFASGGQRIGVSASAPVLPMNIHGWFSLGRTGWKFRNTHIESNMLKASSALLPLSPTLILHANDANPSAYLTIVVAVH